MRNRTSDGSKYLGTVFAESDLVLIFFSRIHLMEHAMDLKIVEPTHKMIDGKIHYDLRENTFCSCDHKTIVFPPGTTYRGVTVCEPLTSLSICENCLEPKWHRSSTLPGLNLRAVITQYQGTPVQFFVQWKFKNKLVFSLYEGGKGEFLATEERLIRDFRSSGLRGLIGRPLRAATGHVMDFKPFQRKDGELDVSTMNRSHNYARAWEIPRYCPDATVALPRFPEVGHHRAR